MSTPQATSAQAGSASPLSNKILRRKKKDLGRKKRAHKLKTDSAFAKAYHESKSKRAADKKTAFRKKKSRKK
jgi:hypothetical protein